jgi:predicted regulator of Ras-like GTPase activity (Roadblock/LC7/MglB family)
MGMASSSPSSSRTLERWLASLRDIDGVLGSFVMNSDGDLVDGDRSKGSQVAFDRAGLRLLRLRDALAMDSGEVSTIVIRFPNHKVALRSLPGGVLVVVALASVNEAALRTGMNLVGQKCPDLSALTKGLSSEIPPPPVAPTFGRDPTQTLISSVPIATLERNEPPASSKPTDRTSAPQAGLAPPSRKPRAVFFRGKRIG